MKSLLRPLLICHLFSVVLLAGQAALAAPLILDARADITRLKIADKNAIGDSLTDDSPVVQAAIDHLAKNPDGGSLVFGPGTYRVGGLVVAPKVKIIGASREKTIFRAANRQIIFDMQGGELHNFTVYGTPDEATSGPLWQVGTGGVGKDGSAWASFAIRVGNSPELIAKDVVISNVTAKEVRYDCLYTRGSQNLRVLNCEFDRAGRNNVSLVGNDEGFLFSGCRIGSLWGLYHFDFEPNKGRYVRDGVIINCEFDGRQAGQMNTDRWGAMLIFSGNEEMSDRNIAVIGSTFHEISVRVRGIFPGIQLLYNPQVGQLVKVRTNPTGELRDAAIRGNRFGTAEKPMENISSGVTFTGDSRFEGNFPIAVNQTKITAASDKTQWEEDHPVAQQPLKAPAPSNIKESNSFFSNSKQVIVPLMGHRFNFESGKILKNREEGIAHLIFHTDPLMAEGQTTLQLLKDEKSKPDNNWISKALWGVKTGDVIAVKTARRTVLMKILDQQKDSYTIEYSFLD
jgi:hypothetical protein